MLKIGVIGLNEGNGHPYSYSAIFNGYDETALQECPFRLIREYLRKEHRNEVFIENAKVTHIWTQTRSLSELVARIAKIPHVVAQPHDLIGQVDGILLLRDDIENHWPMAEPFLKAAIPIYIDKVLAHNMQDLARFIRIARDGYPLMAGSPSRYTRQVEKAKTELDIARVRTIHGVSRCTWLRYGPHIFDAMCELFGADVETVQNLGEKGFDIVHLRYRRGLHAILQVIEDLSLPIQFTCYSSMSAPVEDAGARNAPATKSPPEGPCTLPFIDYFHSYRQLLMRFVHMLETGEQPVAFGELAQCARVIIAGEVSREQGNRVVHMEELKQPARGASP